MLACNTFSCLRVSCIHVYIIFQMLFSLRLHDYLLSCYHANKEGIMARIKLPAVTEEPKVMKVVDAESCESCESCESRESREAMEVNQIIKHIMDTKHVSQTDMKDLLEMKSQSGVSQALRRDMKISMVLRFLKALDCKLIIEHGDNRYEVTE